MIRQARHDSEILVTSRVDMGQGPSWCLAKTVVEDDEGIKSAKKSCVFFQKLQPYRTVNSKLVRLVTCSLFLKGLINLPKTGPNPNGFNTKCVLWSTSLDLRLERLKLGNNPLTP